VTSVGGAGLTWSLVVRNNAQSGTSEVWRALAAAPLVNVSVAAAVSQATVSTITVLSFTAHVGGDIPVAGTAAVPLNAWSRRPDGLEYKSAPHRRQRGLG
jgi:hypothetical protein